MNKIFVAVHFFLFFYLSHKAIGKEVRCTFEISYVSGSPDGVWTDKILTVNGRFPGPSIEAEVGDTLRITVINRIQDGQDVTLHWHGIHQKGTPFQDGPAHITQCPIKQNSSQVYTFKVPIAGTYWYHSHVNSQYTEGLWGPIIVRDSLRDVWRNKYDEEILITLSDWYHNSALENEEWFLKPVNKVRAPPFPSSVLMNGKGRYPCTFARLQQRLCKEDYQQRPVFHLKPGRNYKLRLINASGWASFNFTIEGHILRTIEVDGVETIGNLENAKAGISIGVGQRYSFLLSTLPDVLVSDGQRFLIRANLRNEFLFLRPGNINPFPEALINEVTGVMQYSTATTAPHRSISQYVRSSLEPFNYTRRHKSKPWNTTEFINELHLLPLDGKPVPKRIDKQVILNITFEIDEHKLNRGSFNGRPFLLHHKDDDGKPPLAKMISGERLPDHIYPVEVEFGDVVEVIINNPMEGPHPIHLHGHHFWVVGMGRKGAGSYDPKKHELQLTGYRRDTVMVHEGSWLVIRFQADNIGIWTLHCHVDWHNLSGMAMTFVEASELAWTLRIPSEAKRTCAERGIKL